MLRLPSTKLAQNIVNYTNLQLIRHRKPRWLPTAKSKLFRVPQRPQIPKEDSEELKRLYNIYRTQIKSLKNYFTEKYSSANLEQFDLDQHNKSFKEDFKRCSDINDVWNQQIKMQREHRVANELEESIALAKQRIEDRKLRQIEKLQAAEKIVQNQIEASKDFITPEKLDAAIEYAINNPVDYNFALNKDGSLIHGRENVDMSKIQIKQ